MRRLVVSVVSPLRSVMALSMSLGACTLGLNALLVYEWLERGNDTNPDWYLPLRLNLTAALTGSLTLALLI